MSEAQVGRRAPMEKNAWSHYGDEIEWGHRPSLGVIEPARDATAVSVQCGRKRKTPRKK